MSYATARRVAGLSAFADLVTLAQEENYLKEVAFFQTLQRQSFYEAILRQQAAAAATAAAAAAPTTAPSPGGGSDATSTNTADWACIRAHESGGNYGEAGGGAYQFEFATWNALTGLGSPAQDSPPSVQDAAALRLFDQRGWAPWTTRSVCGL
jgi:muramidase (phage lysozyme)